jgi:hypothetical protein
MHKPRSGSHGFDVRSWITNSVQESNTLLLVGHRGEVTELISESRHSFVLLTTESLEKNGRPNFFFEVQRLSHFAQTGAHMSSTTITVALSPSDTSFGFARNFLAKYASDQRRVPKPIVPLVVVPIKDGHIEDAVKKVRKIASEMAAESFSLAFSGVRQNSIGKIKLNVAGRFVEKTNSMRNTIGAALGADLEEV